jgi:hypothetical protein
MVRYGFDGRFEPDELHAFGGGPVWSNSTCFRPQRSNTPNIVGVPK